MRRKSTIIALVIGLSLFGLACSKNVAVANMSEDDKHKLFQAVGITQEMDLILEASQKMGLADAKGNPTPAMQPFIQAHTDWARKNSQFVMDHMSKEKAKEYATKNMPK